MAYREKKRSGECVKVTKYEANLKRAHKRVPKNMKDQNKKVGRNEDASVQKDTRIGMMINTQMKNDLKLNNHT